MWLVFQLLNRLSAVAEERDGNFCAGAPFRRLFAGPLSFQPTLGSRTGPMSPGLTRSSEKLSPSRFGRNRFGAWLRVRLREGVDKRPDGSKTEGVEEIVGGRFGFLLQRDDGPSGKTGELFVAGCESLVAVSLELG